MGSIGVLDITVQRKGRWKHSGQMPMHGKEYNIGNMSTISSPIINTIQAKAILIPRLKKNQVS